jgi:TRAP-type C4-dicarboxylate transport system permease small subunit
VQQKSKFGTVVGIVVRVVVMTIVFTLMAFAIGLFCGIITTILYGAIQHIHPDMAWAYRYVAAPFGAAGLVVSFILMLINEIRRARRPLEFSQPATRTF